MDNRELRIGNWVAYDDGTTAQVYGVKFKDVGLYGFPQMLSESVIIGISLTAEILEKCGFKKFESTTEHLKSLSWYSLDWIVGYKSMGPDAPHGGFTIENISYGNSGGRKIELAYLHQLQNLYYALTYRELEINL